MAKTKPPVVCDAGPVIHLDELGCLDLLADFVPLLLPRQVWSEVTQHRVQLTSADMPTMRIVEVSGAASTKLSALSDSLALHAGERAALGLLQNEGARLLLCDDAAARLAAESLGFEVHGTIGVIVRSIRRQMRTREQVVTILRELAQRSTLHLSSELLKTVIAQVEGSAGLS
jgi:predicted nucleic acid-binding protein